MTIKWSMKKRAIGYSITYKVPGDQIMAHYEWGDGPHLNQKIMLEALRDLFSEMEITRIECDNIMYPDDTPPTIEFVITTPELGDGYMIFEYAVTSGLGHKIIVDADEECANMVFDRIKSAAWTRWLD
jgi:hypothetical protein